MKPYVSDFERGRKIVLVLLVLAIAFGVVALCSAENSNYADARTAGKGS